MASGEGSLSTTCTQERWPRYTGSKVHEHTARVDRHTTRMQWVHVVPLVARRWQSSLRTQTYADYAEAHTSMPHTHASTLTPLTAFTHTLMYLCLLCRPQ